MPRRSRKRNSAVRLPGIRRLRIAARHHDDHVCPIDGRFEIRRYKLDCSKAAFLPFDLHPADRSNFGELRSVDVVEPQLEAGNA